MAKFLVVEREKIISNIKTVKEIAGTSMIFGVLKSNAYGLGLLEMAMLMRNEGISRFAVTEPKDLILLRDSGFIDEDVLILRSTSIAMELQIILEYNGIATIGSPESALHLNGIAQKNGASIDAHIAVDTGLGRYGFLPHETDKILSVYRYMEHINVLGFYTDLVKPKNPRAANQQIDELRRVAGVIKASGFDPGILHAAGSEALFYQPSSRLDAVRIGQAFAGRLNGQPYQGLEKVGYAECPVTEIKWLSKGHFVGRGGGYKCARPTKIGILPIGYTDGFAVERPNNVKLPLSMAFKLWLRKRRLQAVINNRTARIIGAVDLQHCAVDITNIDCAVGDMARLEINPIIAGNLLQRRYE